MTFSLCVAVATTSAHSRLTKKSITVQSSSGTLRARLAHAKPPSTRPRSTKEWDFLGRSGTSADVPFKPATVRREDSSTHREPFELFRLFDVDDLPNTPSIYPHNFFCPEFESRRPPDCTPRAQLWGIKSGVPSDQRSGDIMGSSRGYSALQEPRNRCPCPRWAGGQAGVHDRRDEREHVPDQARVEGGGDDVVGSEAYAPTVAGGRDFVRHGLARQHGQGAGRGDLNFVVHPACTHVLSAEEDVV